MRLKRRTQKKRKEKMMMRIENTKTTLFLKDLGLVCMLKPPILKKIIFFITSCNVCVECIKLFLKSI